MLGLLGPLRRGGELRHLGRFDPAAAAAALSDGATMLFGVPTMYHRLGREAETDADIVDGLKKARLLVSGSAPLPAPEFTRIEQLTGQQIVERYGLTETLMNTAVRADSSRARATSACPSRASRCGSSATTARRSTAADDETIGEVDRARRPTSSPATSTAPTPPRGDARRLVLHRRPRHRRRGRLLAHRRSPLDDLIKTGGYKVGAGEIEVALLEHPGVSRPR